MSKKIKLGILFGGKSAEHEISIRSAQNIADAVDKTKYDVVLIGIDKKGAWHFQNSTKELLEDKKGEPVTLAPECNGTLLSGGKIYQSNFVDVIFPILHGPFGEDGTVQGLLKLANVPFVGSGVLGSAVGMDKDVMKRLLRDAGIPIGKFKAFKDVDVIDFAMVVKELGLPLFIKPANLGSSVGISKAKNEDEFKKAVKGAFLFDTKIIVEEFIEGREIECAVLGNENPVASVAGEVVVKSDFYSYEAKYMNENGATTEIPAKISVEIMKKVQELSVKTFQTLSCEGLGRVDFFLKKNGDLLVNEINTIPGFTSISMYPKLWEASGIKYAELIDRLVELAIARFEKEQKLQTSYK